MSSASSISRLAVVDYVLKRELAEIQEAAPSDAHKLANDPRVISYIAISDFVWRRIKRHPMLYSYIVSDENRTRCAETFGWRLFFNTDDAGNASEVIGVARVADYKREDIRTTLEAIESAKRMLRNEEVGRENAERETEAKAAKQLEDSQTAEKEMEDKLSKCFEEGNFRDAARIIVGATSKLRNV